VGEGNPARVSIVKLHGDQVTIVLQVQQPCGEGQVRGSPRAPACAQPGSLRHSHEDTAVYTCGAHVVIRGTGAGDAKPAHSFLNVCLDIRCYAQLIARGGAVPETLPRTKTGTIGCQL
jgi:hypothetical protein